MHRNAEVPGHARCAEEGVPGNRESGRETQPYREPKGPLNVW